MTMESDVNFEDKQTFGFEKDMRNLLFLPEHSRVSKLGL